jgi:predicted TIM-barrel fold metal-dependent hydrolase
VPATHFTTDPIRVIDADSHITEPPGLWIDNAPAALKDRVPRIVDNEQGRPTWVVDGNLLGPIGFTAVGPDGNRIAGETTRMNHRFEDLHQGAYDFKARLGWLDSRGIHQQVLFPNISGFGGLKFLQVIPDSDLRTACVTIYNDAAACIQAESGGRLLPLALVPWWDTDLAEKEVVRIRTELDLKGITMCEAPHHFGYPSLDQPAWDRFWSVCEDTSLAVAFHISSGPSDRQNVWSQNGGGEQLATLTANSFLSNSWIISNLLFSGVLLRHPRLKIFSAETGIGWIPFLLEAMDYQWHENLVPDVKRDVWKAMLPSELFRRNIYVSFWFEQWGLSHALDVVGEDNVMFETDFPHGTSLTDRVTERVAITLAGLSPEARKKVLHDNAARLYNLE